MINIRINPDWAYENYDAESDDPPVPSANLKGIPVNQFTLAIGDDRYPILSGSRASGEPRNSGSFQINLSVNSDFQIQDHMFETLVKSSEGGGGTDLVMKILYYASTPADTPVILVTQDDGDAMTPAQIMDYTAP